MRFSGLILAACLLLTMAGCVTDRSFRPIVTVTLPVQKMIVEQISGDRIDVRCLLAEGANPETYDPSVTNMMNLERSVAFLRAGNVGFEDAILDKLSAVNGKLQIYDTSEGIEFISGTHKYHHHLPDSLEDSEPDPHTWNSVRNMKAIAVNITSALDEIDSANSALYHKNLARLTARLDSLDRDFSHRLSQAGNPGFMVWHPSLSYFARDYGLEQIVIGGSESKESSVKKVREAIDKAKSQGINVAFAERNMDSRRLETVIKATDAREVMINTLSDDWENEMIKIVNSLTDGHCD